MVTTLQMLLNAVSCHRVTEEHSRLCYNPDVCLEHRQTSTKLHSITTLMIILQEHFIDELEAPTKIHTYHPYINREGIKTVIHLITSILKTGTNFTFNRSWLHAHFPLESNMLPVPTLTPTARPKNQATFSSCLSRPVTYPEREQHQHTDTPEAEDEN
jgi:hypothetical protein